MTGTGAEPPDDAPVDYPDYAALPPPVYPGYPPPGPYGYGYPMGKPPGTNGKAIGALVASAFGVLCCGVSAIAGVILGVVAMRETKRTGQDGFGIALAATIIGGLVLAGYLLYLLLYVAVFASGSSWA